MKNKKKLLGLGLFLAASGILLPYTTNILTDTNNNSDSVLTISNVIAGYVLTDGKVDLDSESINSKTEKVIIKKANKCDINEDGAVDVADRAAFNDQCVGGTDVSKCDLNGDGAIDVADISAFNDCLPKTKTTDTETKKTKKANKCDINEDGAVDVADRAAFNDQCVGGTDVSKCDLNGDGAIDVADISAFNDCLPGKTDKASDKESNNNKGKSTNSKYPKEMLEAYQFAYQNGIITSDSIDKAKMNSPLTRIAMAKMLSNYAINILGKKPDTSKGTKNFIDVTAKQNADYDNAVTLSYQLGIMGQGTNKFRPNDEVTRAEFATALSRLLYSTPDGTNKYYTTHITKLKEDGIISNDNPNIKEKRGYVMLMLMRSVE